MPAKSADRTPEPIMPPRVSLLVPLIVLLGALHLGGGSAQAAVTPTCEGVPATIFKADGSPGRLAGTKGDDVIVGSIGRDNIEAGDGDDLICTVDGRDSILGGNGADRIHAGSGNDEVESGAGTGDDVYGGEGRDLIAIDSVNSAAHGEGGSDHLVSLGNVVYLDGGTGDDVLDGGSRTDTIDGGDGKDSIGGGDGKDMIAGDGGNDSILAGKANDTVEGGSGDDGIEGGAGTDIVHGDEGRDVLDTDTGIGDTLYGGADDDHLVLLARGSDAFGEGGNDDLSTAEQKTALDGGDGNDVIDGGPYADTIDGGTGNDRIDGGNGSDRMSGEAGADRITTGKGASDLAAGGLDGDAVTGTSSGASLRGDEGADTLTAKAEGVRMDGGADNDRLVGGKFDDRGTGGTGNDTINGADGSDDLHGGDGTDTLNGGTGNDSLFGDADADRCAGAAGKDLCHGGAPGGEANSSSDTDVCEAEKKKSCKAGNAGHLDGSASGSVTVVGGDELVGVSEDWSAEFGLDEYFEGGYKGEATFNVGVSGTDQDGCTYAGGGTVTGTAEMTIFEDDDPAQSYYSVTLQKKEGSFPVTVSCPDGSHSENWVPLQYPDLMRTYDYPFYEEGMTTFEGGDSYETTHFDYEMAVDWNWSIG